MRVNQWQAFLEQLFKLHEIPDLQKVNTYQSAFYYWVKWGLHGSFLGEELLIDQHLQQQISTHPLSIPALLAPGEHSLTALHWLFLDRCQKKPKFFLNIFLPALSLAIPENLSQVVTILLQPFTYGSLDKCLLEYLAECPDDLGYELKLLFTLKNQELLIKFIQQNRSLLGTVQLVTSSIKIKEKYPEISLFDNLALLNIEELFNYSPTDSSLLISLISTKSSRKHLADLFLMDSFASQWKMTNLSDAYVSSLIHAVRCHILGNIDAKQEQKYLPQLLAEIFAHQQIIMQIKTQQKFAKLKKWLPNEAICEQEIVCKMHAHDDDRMSHSEPLFMAFAEVATTFTDEAAFELDKETQKKNRSSRLSKKQKRKTGLQKIIQDKANTDVLLDTIYSDPTLLFGSVENVSTTTTNPSFRVLCAESMEPAHKACELDEWGSNCQQNLELLEDQYLEKDVTFSSYELLQNSDRISLVVEKITKDPDEKIMPIASDLDTLGAYYIDESLSVPIGVKKQAHQFFIYNQDGGSIKGLLDKLLEKWAATSPPIHPLYDRARDCSVTKPFNIVSAKYFCLCLQIENISYDLLEYSYIVTLIDFFHQNVKRSPRSIRNAVEWVSKVNLKQTNKERLRRMIYDLVWLSPLKEEICQLLQQMDQVETVTRVPFDVLQRGNDLFGLVASEAMSHVERSESVSIPTKWQDFISVNTEDERAFEWFLHWLCYDEARVYFVGSRVLSKTPFSLEGNDFDFDIHFSNMPIEVLGNKDFLSNLTYTWLQSRVHSVWPGQNIVRCANNAFNEHYLWFSYKVKLPNRDMDFRFLCSDYSSENARIFSQSERCYSERASIWSLKDGVLYRFIDDVRNITKPEEQFTYNNVCYLLRCITREESLQRCSPKVVNILQQIIDRYENNPEDRQRMVYIWYEQTKNKPTIGPADLAVKKAKKMLSDLFNETQLNQEDRAACISPLSSETRRRSLSFFGTDDSVISLASSSPTADMRSQSPGESVSSSGSSKNLVKTALF